MRKKRYFQLPKGYLSYSQVTLWLGSPEKYIQLYLDGRDELRYSNSGQEYGKVVANALEQGIVTDDLLTDSAILLLPKYDVADQEIKVEFETKAGIIPILGRPDTMDSVTKNFREYKTGKHPWTPKKAQDHLQMRFYAMIIYLKFGVVLNHAYLDWIETEQTESGIQPTGRVKSFKVVFTMEDILKTMAMVSRVAKEIEIATIAHVPDPRLKW